MGKVAVAALRACKIAWKDGDLAVNKWVKIDEAVEVPASIVDELIDQGLVERLGGEKPVSAPKPPEPVVSPPAAKSEPPAAPPAKKKPARKKAATKKG